jgi:hypothetical protein
VKSKQLIRRTVVGCCGIVLILTSGCSRWIELMAIPGSAQGFSKHMIAQQEQVPLLLDRVQITRNGSPQNPSIETERRVLGTLSEIGLFARLGSAGSVDPSINEKVIHARIVIDEAQDSHPGAAALKGIAIGASMFLLTPVMPLEYDYAAHFTLELERWDGQIKRYESQSAGIAHYQLFGATPLLIDELKGHVTESCLTALMQQVVEDTRFYTASSAPLPDNPIRSVTVKARRSEPATIPAVPISTSSEN